MSNVLCENCGKGPLTLQEIKNYPTTIKGKRLIVPLARVRVCATCKAVYTPAKELHRWIELAAEISLAPTPLPKRIQALRERLSLSVNDFARLIGATRQSVYSWENDVDVIPPIRPIGLLLLLLEEGVEKGPIDPLAFLRMAQFGKGNKPFSGCRAVHRRGTFQYQSIDKYETALKIPPDTKPKAVQGLY